MAEIHVAICAIKAELAKHGGITKDRTAPPGAGNFKFRGIEDFDDVLCGLTAKHGVVISPEILSHEFRAATTAKGAPQTHALIATRWHFVSSKDDSKVTADTVGEALDTSDKAANKAIQASRKYAYLTVFMIPVSGDDTEAYAETAAPAIAPAPPPQQASPQNGAGPGPAKATRQRQPKPQPEAPPPPPPESPFDDRASGEEILGAIGETKTFPALLVRAQDADTVTEEPLRSELFQAIKMRGVVLFAHAKTAKDVEEGVPLVKLLGSPEELKRAGNQAYARFRQP